MPAAIPIIYKCKRLVCIIFFGHKENYYYFCAKLRIKIFIIMSMNLPDFMSYSNKFTSGDFVEKISRIAKRAGAKMIYAALVLYYTLQSDKISVKDKAIIIGALGYLISPLDVIPDAIPIAGLGDDLAVLVYVLNKVWGNVSEDVKEKAKAKLSKWFDEDEIAEINTLFDKDIQ